MTDGQASWGMGMVQAARQVLAKASAGVKDAAETIFGGELAEMEAVGEGEEAGCKSGRMSSEGTAAGLLGEAARNTGARDTAARAQSRQVASGLSRATGTGTSTATASFRTSGFNAVHFVAVPRLGLGSLERCLSFHRASLARCS